MPLFYQVLAMLEESCPGLQEISLLRDALKQLDDLFLLVVVGEWRLGLLFRGKSVTNARPLMFTTLLKQLDDL